MYATWTWMYLLEQNFLMPTTMYVRAYGCVLCTSAYVGKMAAECVFSLPRNNPPPQFGPEIICLAAASSCIATNYLLLVSLLAPLNIIVSMISRSDPFDREKTSTPHYYYVRTYTIRPAARGPAPNASMIKR